jgi:hypothetical protein
MNSHKIFMAGAVLAFAVAGCNANGYADLNSKIDETRLCQAKSTAWIRYSFSGEGETEEEQLVTEVLILGQAVSGDDKTGSDCLYLAQFDYEGSILLDQGRFVLEDATLVDPVTEEYELEDPPAEGEAYRGTWSTSYLYDFIREPDKGILARRGAQRSQYPLPAGQAPPSLPRMPVDEAQPLEREIEFSREGNRLSFTVDGNTKWFEEFGPLVDSLDPNDPEQLTYFVRMANLGLLVSQVRVIGFGASGMTGYSQPKDFAGLMTGNLNVGINVKLGKVNATLDYGDFSDIPGLNLHGAQLVNVNWSGDGSMDGSQALELSENGQLPFFVASIDYGDTTVKDGFGDSGTIPMVTDTDEEFTFEVEDSLIVDFRGMPGFEPDEGS